MTVKRKETTETFYNVTWKSDLREVFVTTMTTE
jgi:hypothetical protein